jgi:hypothetical protein
VLITISNIKKRVFEKTVKKKTEILGEPAGNFRFMALQKSLLLSSVFKINQATF